MLGPVEIFTFFFVTLGPLKILGPFVQRTRGVNNAAVREIAVRAFVIATMAIVVGGLLGRALLPKWHVSPAAMELTGGIVFFLVALKQLLEQYEPPHPAQAEPLPPAPTAAAAQLVFPIVITAYGIAGVIALLAASDRPERTAMILVLLLIVMVLDLLAMLYARRILVGPTIIVLQVLGAVLAVMQVGLSVQLILVGLRSLGVIAR
jgi:multiple antibiotic resistance protein